MQNEIEVSVAIIRNHLNEIFITQRGEDSHLAGYWEFPGGKIKNNETPFDALKRELLEEIDIVIHDAALFHTVHHQYPDRTIKMYVYLVTEWDGEPFAFEGQLSRWVPIYELIADEFPKANREIIEILKDQEG